MPNLTNTLPPAQKALVEKAKRIKEQRNPTANKTGRGSPYSDKYWHDFKQWITDCIVWKEGEAPTPYQLEMAEMLITHKRLSGRGPHGLGKTSFNSWLVLWFATTRDAAGVDWKIPTTAGAWRQLTKFLWPEVRKWARRLRWDIIGRDPFHPVHELQALSLKLKHGEAFAVASDTPDLIEGAHADQLLYIFDEGKSISAATYNAAEGAFSNTGANPSIEAYAVAMSTPGEPLGQFYDIQSKKPGFEDWAVRYVTFDEVVRAGRATWKWANDRKAQWGEDSAIYQNKVLGKFASADEQGVIPLAWVEAANARWLELEDSGELDRLRSTEGKIDAIGVDVGEWGDQSVMALRSGQVIVELRHLPKQDVMRTTGRVYPIASKYGASAVVDVIGIGAGVVARLRELADELVNRRELRERELDRGLAWSRQHGPGADMGESEQQPDQEPVPEPKEFEVVSFHAAEGSTMKDHSGEMGFLNKRAEIWWLMRERLDPHNPDNAREPVALPPDDKLIGDLVAPRYKVTSRGEYQIEKKDEVKKRLGRSTDSADAVLMAYYQGSRFGRIRRL